MWECQWKKLKSENKDIKLFLQKSNLTQRSVFGYKKDLSQQEILDKVKTGRFFGLVQCSLHTPDHLKEKFSDLPPIFKNTEISIDDIGPHMREYCLENNLLGQKRRALISSYFGEDILLASPLLQWYLEQGLEVTDIKQIIEYKPKCCFESFGDDVTTARRAGDLNTDSSILADSYKLLGNSGIFSLHI